MNNKAITINRISKGNGELRIYPEISTDIKQYFKESVYYAQYNIDISTVPDSIAIIPFLTNVLPIMWLANVTIYVDELDLAFYEHIVDIRHGYEKMYPKLKFDGHLVIGKLVDNNGRIINMVCCFRGVLMPLRH